MDRTINGFGLETEEAPTGQSAAMDERQQQTFTTLDKIFSAAQPGAAFSPPVVSHNYTVITACEVGSGGGVGYGGGTAPAQEKGEQAATEKPVMTSGMGGGGGGGAMTRPVAAIIIGPDGVRVEPIVDVTKLGLAAIALAIPFFGIFRGLRRGRGR